jgi:pimeloyl-ACP methyl ester carboxylesterase
VIAHSLGTYLIARILQKYDEITVDRLVLVGAVVPRMFDWESILKKNREAFLEIRNEVGQKDWVVQLVGAIKWFVRDFGNSGLRGAFTGLRHHNLNNPWVPCELCNDVVEPVRYHNVMLQEFLHSDWFLGPGHASKVWLPYLWGYTPQEFKEWQQLCWSATYLAQEHQWRACRQVETILRRRRWAWTTIVDLETYISEEIRETASAFAIALETNDFRTILNDVVRDLHLCVTEAILESKNINGQHSIIRPLHPLIAIARAVINELPIDEAG